MAEGQGADQKERGKTVHGEVANAGHRVLAPDDAEVEAYLEVALDAPPPARPTNDEPGARPDSVIVLDFGGQTAQLIARRVRELNVYSELLPFDTPWSEIERRQPRAVILSGGPMSVYEAGSPHPDPQIWSDAGMPVLGICYGVQLMASTWVAKSSRPTSASTARQRCRSRLRTGCSAGSRKSSRCG